jgi:hypothetical protein
MAKKKHFAGKKTKLARLPLTQALANQAEEEAPSRRPPAPALSWLPQASLTWDEVSDGRAGPPAAAFYSLVRELAELKSGLHSAVDPPAGNHRAFLPDRVPRPPEIMHALRQARQSLLDLQRLLSQSS